MNGHDIADRNLERLLETAYKPEHADPQFAQAVEEYLCEVAQEQAAQRSILKGPAPASVEDPLRLRRLRRRFGWSMAVAASLFLCVLILYGKKKSVEPAHPLAADPQVKQEAVQDEGEPRGDRDNVAFGQTPQARPQSEPTRPLAVGASLTTRAGERRRVALADGSILYLNQNTTVSQPEPRQLKLSKGEVYVEVAPRPDNPFLVHTPAREVKAVGTRFAVQAQTKGTGVVVTQGSVKVSGVKDVVKAGQQVEPGTNEVEAAPRATHVLDWTRELMAAAESPLVPCSKFSGGALVALDPNGQEVNLTLRQFKIDVHIEDGFARTTIDQTYFNNQYGQLEGTFYFPLPADATLSRLAMYVEEGGDMWKLNEGGMGDRDHLRTVYETIRHARRDPALLEWVDGSTFKMRVFPLEPRREKRIILSYTQRLSSLYGVARYRFPGGLNMDLVENWQFHARLKNAAAIRCTSDSHPKMDLRIDKGTNDLVATASETLIKPDKDVTLEIFENAPVREKSDAARFSSYLHEGAQYLMLRYRPTLQSQPKSERRDWVFLFESSANRDPLVARAQIEVIRNLLVNAEHDDTFSLITAGTRVRLFDKAPRRVTEKNIAEATRFLETTHLIGALDLGHALQTVQPLLQKAANPCLVHVGAGVASMGELRHEVLVKMIPERARYVGVGVGKRWNRTFMKQAADRTAGHFTQINPDEPIAWKAFDLLATLNTPRLQELRVIDNAERVTFLSETASLSQGEELCAITRIDQSGTLPESVTVFGKVDGKPFDRKLLVKDMAHNAAYLPRAWAKIEIDRLLENAEANKKQIIDLSMKSYVMSPFTSLLVLETDAQYQQFKVDRGRKDHWAQYPLVERMKSKGYEAGQAQPVVNDPKEADAQRVLNTVLLRVPVRTLIYPNEAVPQLPHAVTAGQYLGAFAVPVLMTEDEEDFGGFAYDPLRTWNRRPGFSDTRGILQKLSIKHGAKPGDPFVPTEDSQLGGQHGGRLDAARLKDLAEHWGRLPSPNRVKVLREITKDLPPRQRDLVQEYFLRLDPAVRGKVGQSGMGSKHKEESPVIARHNLLMSFDQPRTATGTVPFRPFPTKVPRPPIANSSGTSTLVNPIAPALPPVSQAKTVPVPASTLPTPPPVMPVHPSMGLPAPAFPPMTYSGPAPIQFAPTFVSPQMQWAVPNTSLTGPAMGNYAGFGAYGFYPPGYYHSQPFNPYSSGMPGYYMPVPQSFPVTPLSDKERQALRGLFTGTDNGRTKLPDVATHPLPRLDRRIVEGGWLEPRLEQLIREAQDKKAALPSYLYQRPAFSGDQRVFHDLVQYAPGLNTNWADIAHVIESETKAKIAFAGTIDDQARTIIARARAAGWHTVVYPGQDKNPGLTIHINGQGQYRYERTLAFNLGEIVVCDGKKLRHLYPEIGLGAERPATRFQRAELGELVPWFVPPVEDLIHGADVKSVDASTVAVIPHGQRAKDAESKPLAVYEYHLVFAEDGRLRERRLVNKTAGKVHYRETYSAEAVVRRGADGKEIATIKVQVSPAKAPNLTPDTHDLVMLSLPIRTFDQILQRELAARGQKDAGHWPDFHNWTEETALAMFASECLCRQNGFALQIFFERFHSRGDKRLGLYTLLLASGQNAFHPGTAMRFNNGQIVLDPVAEHPKSPLAKFLAHAATQQSQGKSDALGNFAPKNSFLAQVGAFRDIYHRWVGKNSSDLRAHWKRDFAYIKSCPSPAWAWILLETMQKQRSADIDFQALLAEAFGRLENVPGLEYFARYESARATWLAGKGPHAFDKLYRDAVVLGHLPLIDQDFRDAMRRVSTKGLALAMQHAADECVKHGAADNVMVLVWQAQQLGETALALDLFDHCFRGLKAEERRLLGLTGLSFLRQQPASDSRLEKVVDELLADKHLAEFASLWRLAGQVAQGRKAHGRAIACIEKAMDLEFKYMPEIVNLQTVRSEYQGLMNHYQEMAKALNVLDMPASKDFLARVVRAADRWRAIDPEADQACRQAANVLQLAGGPEAAELAWEYLTTPLALKPNESTPWLSLANTLKSEQKVDLAHRAFSMAHQAEPTNAQILFDHAQYLQSLGRNAEAHDLFLRIVNTEWPDNRFPGLRDRARQQVR